MDTALGLSLWSQSTGHRRRRDPSNPAPLEPSLTLSLSDIDACRPSAAKNEASTVSSFSTADGHDTPSPAVVKRESEEGERVSSRGSGDEDEEGGAAASSRKKLRLTKEQSALLEDRFKEHSTLNPKQKQALAMQLSLRPRQVEVWFQNRRARTKLKQTEVDCEVLKRCCETLTDENRRLQKELQELRAIKLLPPPQPLYVQFPAAGAAITVCPSCGGTSKAGSPFAAAPSKPQFFSPFTHSSAAC